MDGGHPIAPVAVPPSGPAGQPTRPQWCHVRITPPWLSVGSIPCNALINPTTGRCMKYNHPSEENAVDPIATAEQFNNEAEARTEAARQQVRAQRRARLERRFLHHPPTSPLVIEQHEQVREMGDVYAKFLFDNLPDCDEVRKAIDAIDLATMYANAAIARTQLKGAPAPVDTPVE